MRVEGTERGIHEQTERDGGVRDGKRYENEERMLRRWKERHRVMIQEVNDDSKVEGGIRKGEARGDDMVEDFVSERGGERSERVSLRR